MSRAVELAKKTGCSVALDYPIRKPRFTFFEEELEAFYHAARAEMAREAAEFADDYSEQCAAQYRAMADREGK